MKDNEKPQWTNDAIEKSHLKIELSFRISDHVYYGDPNDRVQLDREEEYSEPIPKLDLPIEFSEVESKDVLGKEAELIKYYTFVIQTLESHGNIAKKRDLLFEHQRYFWLRLRISNKNVSIGFLWYDTFSEINVVLDTLDSDEIGLIYSDLEQGWGIDIYADNDFFYFYYCGEDRSEPYCITKIKKNRLKPQIAPLKERVKKIIGKLTEHFGVDYWTAPPDWWMKEGYRK